VQIYKKIMETEIKKSTRGGAREGAGRKKKHSDYVAVTLRLSALAKAKLQAYARSNGISAQEAARRILESLDV
jgi:hypothetical protein